MCIKRNSIVQLQHGSSLLHPTETACPCALFVQHGKTLICRWAVLAIAHIAKESIYWIFFRGNKQGGPKNVLYSTEMDEYMQYEFIFVNSQRNNASYFNSPLELLLWRNVLNAMHFSCAYLNMKIQQHEATSVPKKKISAWHLDVSCVRFIWFLAMQLRSTFLILASTASSFGLLA